MKHIILIFMLGILSCTSPKKTKFEKDGISFICPDGWSITEEDSLGGEGYSLSVEKSGFSQSGLISISWVNGDISLNEYITIMQDELKKNIVFRNSNLQISQPYTSTFGKDKTLASRFTSTVLGMKNEGIIHCFYGKNKTICIFRNEAIDDRNKNNKGFQIIENSFSNQKAEH